MKKQQINTVLEKIEPQLVNINIKLDDILIKLQQKPLPLLPEKANAPNPLGHRKCRNHKLFGGFRDPAIRRFIISMRKQGEQFTNIAIAIKEKYPDNPEKHVSRSAIHRFCEGARKGRLLEYGIDMMLNQINAG